MTEEKYTLMDVILMAIEITKVYLLKGKKEAEKLAKEKFLPAVKKYFKIVAVVFLISLIPTIAAIIFYLSVFRYNELVARTALTWGLVWHIFWTIALVIAVMPITLAYDFITEGIKEGLRKNVRRIESAALTKLIFMLILYFLTPYFKDFSHLSMFFILSCAVAYVIIRFFGNRAAAVAVIFAFILVIAQSTVPDLFKRWLPEKIGGITGNIIKAQPLDITATECEKVDFFHPNGKPRTGYYEAENEKIKVFVAESIAEYKYIDSHFGYELTPMTRGIAKKYCKQLKKAEEEKLTQILPPQPAPEIPLEPVPPGGMIQKKAPEEEEETPKPEPRKTEPFKFSEFRSTRPTIPSPSKQPEMVEPKPNPYVASGVGQKVSYAILITDTTGFSILNDGDVVARRLREKGISASASVLNASFVRDGLFSQAFSGNTSRISEYNFARYADFLVLGKRSAKAGVEELGSGSSYSGDARIDFCIISTTGGARRCGTASGIGVDFDARGAEQNSISSAIAKLVEKIS